MIASSQGQPPRPWSLPGRDRRPPTRWPPNGQAGLAADSLPADPSHGTDRASSRPAAGRVVLLRGRCWASRPAARRVVLLPLQVLDESAGGRASRSAAAGRGADVHAVRPGRPRLHERWPVDTLAGPLCGLADLASASQVVVRVRRPRYTAAPPARWRRKRRRRRRRSSLPPRACAWDACVRVHAWMPRAFEAAPSQPFTRRCRALHVPRNPASLPHAVHTRPAGPNLPLTQTHTGPGSNSRFPPRTTH